MYATIEGVVRAPSEFSITLGWPFSMTATQELVVPRSMPMIFAMFYLFGFAAIFSNCHRYDMGVKRSVFNGFRPSPR